MLLDDFAAALRDAQLVDGTSGWKLYIGYLQDGLDRAVCLYETPGGVPEQRWAIDYPGLQVRVRGRADDFAAVQSKIRAVFDVLHAGEVEVGAAYVYIYALTSEPLSLGQDEKRRPTLVQNYRIMKDRV